MQQTTQQQRERAIKALSSDRDEPDKDDMIALTDFMEEDYNDDTNN